MTFMFLFVYLSLFTNILRKKQNIFEDEKFNVNQK
jgi:hypothetical protein